MRTIKKVCSILLILSFLISSIGFIDTFRASNPELPDYVPVDINNGLAGEISMPEITDTTPAGSYGVAYDFESTPPVGTQVVDWYLGAATGDPYMTLRYVTGNVEIWVQDNLLFPTGDPRNDDPYNLMISEAMLEYLADEFNNVIYPIDTETFGVPFDRDGTNTIFEQYGFPEEYYNWTDTENPQRTILKILNYRDDSYYDPTYPYYVVGFFSPTYNIYYNRNIIHIDPWAYWQRLGPEGTQWFPERPDLVVTRPQLYESVTAHEYQHLIHNDYNPDDPLFMNEGCSMYAEPLCGYPYPWGDVEAYLATPDNSLTEWGDQGDINILADYGAALLFTTYLSDQFGGAEFIGYFVQSGIPGIEGINAALEHFGYDMTFDEAYHNWRIANLIHSNRPGHGIYNYKSIDLSETDPARTYEISGLPIPWTTASEAFGNTTTVLGYDTGVSRVGPYGTDYIKFTDWSARSIWNKILFFKGDTETYLDNHWTLLNGSFWYSGSGDLYNDLIYGEAYVDAGDPTLTFYTYWDLEDYWDFGFVQVSTDGGETWISLENAYTTYDHDPNAHPDVVANLPGLTSLSGGWLTLEFDLSAFSGQNILIGFRHVTDWATAYEGWYIGETTVSGSAVSLEHWIVSLEIDFQVSLIIETKHRHHGRCHYRTKYYVWDMRLCDCHEFGTSLVPLSRKNTGYLVVSPIVDAGFSDYSFKVPRLHRCRCHCHCHYW